VLAVTAVDNGKVADYANRGDFIALGAPGSHLIYYQNQPFTVTGTSAASAFTAGVAASALEAGKTPAEMTAYLRENFGMRPLQPGEVPKP
jgi:subtilisin family serine protease